MKFLFFLCTEIVSLERAQKCTKKFKYQFFEYPLVNPTYKESLRTGINNIDVFFEIS